MAAMGIACSATPKAHGQGAKVEITGGVDESGQNYTWKVANRHDSPIVHVEFPQFHADMFQTPKRWQQSCTNMIGAGKPTHLSGVCIAQADSPQDGIAPGRAAEFGMRLALLGGDHPRPGAVTIRFADGTETVVSGVELPTAAATHERLVSLIGFALIFGIVVLVQVVRRRKKGPARAASAPPAVDQD